ncbi:uncharacterized protein LOC124650570 [Lolium rigidum]|uniref:uncharacterized protein LOC124650570 n=1 Tax=Lolium rigidum TaxID=89674 RepID=UPI001F5C9046|nr:uncharacterized protein LOC124650570 [Lolium rigidum]
MEQALRGHATEEVAGRRPSPPARFTPLELAAAELLVHLSESSCSTGAAFTPRGSGTAASACYSSSSSPRSVNAPPAAPALDDLVVHAMKQEDDDDEGQQEVGGRPRRNRRYRSITDIYDATQPYGARRGKAKTGAGSGADAGGTMEKRRK